MTLSLQFSWRASSVSAHLTQFVLLWMYLGFPSLLCSIYFNQLFALKYPRCYSYMYLSIRVNNRTYRKVNAEQCNQRSASTSFKLTASSTSALCKMYMHTRMGFSTVCVHLCVYVCACGCVCVFLSATDELGWANFLAGLMKVSSLVCQHAHDVLAISTPPLQAPRVISYPDWGAERNPFFLCLTQWNAHLCTHAMLKERARVED